MAGTKISDATTTAPLVSTDMIPFARSADATARHMTVAALDTYLFDRAVTINTTGADVDFNVKASGVANALFVQGSDGAIGFGGVPAAGVVQSYKNIVLDDGFTDSPSLQFVSGSNDDTFKLYLENSGVAGASDVVIALPSTNPGSYVAITDVNVVVQQRFSATGEVVLNEAGNDADFRVEAVGQANALFVQGSNGYIGMGLVPTANMAGLSIEAGLLTLKERALPTADAGYGKIWCESDNTLHFQDGDGTEYYIDMYEMS